jgi:predicted O-linked N-acetylglucosamine transferase (SPINDLY family)
MVSKSKKKKGIPLAEPSDISAGGMPQGRTIYDIGRGITMPDDTIYEHDIPVYEPDERQLKEIQNVLEALVPLNPDAALQLANTVAAFLGTATGVAKFIEYLKKHLGNGAQAATASITFEDFRREATSLAKKTKENETGKHIKDIAKVVQEHSDFLLRNVLAMHEAVGSFKVVVQMQLFIYRASILAGNVLKGIYIESEAQDVLDMENHLSKLLNQKEDKSNRDNIIDNTGYN